MSYKEIICPVCGSNSVEESENGRLKCRSCGTLLENENIYTDTKSIMIYLDGSQFETAENYCRDAISRVGNTPILSWLLFLAKNKIHFVDDPKTGERKPVFYSERVFKRDCVFDDEDYNRAIQGEYKEKYQRFGELIEAIRIELCEKMSKEEDTDIFISFKATEEVTDSEGRIRNVETFDQKKGQEIYDYFTNKGYKVFFSPVSIGKGKVFGEKYEPKIFAALVSCRAMILIGTKGSYVTDGWVRDEWMRYLYFMNRVKNRNSRLCKASNTLLYVFEKNPPNDLPSQISEIEGIDCSSAYYLDDLYKTIKARIGDVNNGIERITIAKGERIKKQTTDIETIKTVPLGVGEISKKQSKIVGNLKIKDFGENKVDYLDDDTQKILDGAFGALQDGNFTFARREFDYVLSSGDNAMALYGKILLTINAKNEDEFIKNAEQFPKSEIAQFDRLMSCANKEEAEKAANLFALSCKQCFEDVENREAIMFFNAVVAYKTSQRNEVINIIKKAIPGLITAHDSALKETIEAYLSTISPEKVDTYIKECTSIVKKAINEGSFSIAEKYNLKILELDEYNHDAMMNRLYILTNSRDIEEFVKNLPSIKYDAVEHIITHSSAKKADDDLVLFSRAYLKGIDSSYDTNKVVSSTTALCNLLKYDFSTRNDVLNSLKESAFYKIISYSKDQFDFVTDFLLKTFDPKSVDEFIGYSIRVANAARNKGYFDIAKKHYAKVISIDNSNLQALYGVLFTDFNLSNDHIYSSVEKFADKDGLAVKELEELLKFSFNAGEEMEEKLKFNNLITSLTDDIILELGNKKVTPEIADAAYLNIVRYIPSKNESFMKRRLLAMANILLEQENFDLANKYYNQVLINDNNNFDALWGLVLCESGCSSNGKLASSDNAFFETKNYIRAYRAASKTKQKKLNDICNLWNETKEKRKLKSIENEILKLLGVSCERDVIKSPTSLSALEPFRKIMNTGDDYMINKWRFIESLQSQYLKLEEEIKKKKQLIDKLK